MQRRQCSPDEQSQFVGHMKRNTETGQWLLEKYNSGARLSRMEVAGAESIGELTSFFKTLGPWHSETLTGRPRFLIREALSLLQGPAGQADADLSKRLSKVVAYERFFHDSASDPMVTVVDFSDGSVVIDGNHTAMAAYLYTKDHQSWTLRLPVFVLAVDSLVAAELG